MRYNPAKIEKKWRKKWFKEKTYEPDLVRAKNPYYNLMMFPYPSAEGLHIGSVRTFTGVDIYGRFKRMQGHDVFEPIGLDGFGIHSENYALRINQHPMKLAKVTEKNFYRQLSEIGNAFAWRERLETYDPAYYQHTQWLFIQMFKHNLAYRKKAKVNWCPSCLTVLADEQVIAGKCERCGTPVVKKDLEQWFFKITDYAERLLANIEKLDWSDPIKTAQRNWIGKSEGAELEFRIKNHESSIKVFTTRPDTLFGATYMVLAPEHPLLANSTLQMANREAVEKYIQAAAQKSEIERTAAGKEKTGIEVKGVSAVNPANQEAIPIWISDYVLATYGTGAIMAVPAHDERDFEFAKKFKLPILQVIEPNSSFIVVISRSLNKNFYEQIQKFAKVTPGTGTWNGLNLIYTEEVGKVFDIAEKNFTSGPWYIHSEGPVKKILLHAADGKNERFDWGNKDEFRKAYEFGIKIEIKKEQLDFSDVYAAYIGEGVLINSGKFNGLKSEEAKWAITKAVGGEKKVQYRLRDWLISRQRYWGPPIPMIFCNDCGWQPVPDKDLPVKLPFIREFRPTGTGASPLASVKSFHQVKCPKCQGRARRETDVSDTFFDSAWYFLRYPSVHAKISKLEIPWDQEITRRWLPVDMYIGGAEHSVLHLLYSRFMTMALHDWGLVHFEEPFATFRAHGLITKNGAKMSKSKGNIVSPDSYMKAYGVDAIRLYLAFLAPLTEGGDFRDSGIRGITRFLMRVWNFYQDPKIKLARVSDEKIQKLVSQTIQKVSRDIQNLQYNTAISALMIAMSGFEKSPENVSKEDRMQFLKLLSPLAPFITEELWSIWKQKGTIHHSRWPEARVEKASDTAEFIIQINGKTRAILEFPRNISEAGISASLAKNNALAKFFIAPPKKVVFIPGRLINFVI
ncbi:MAG: leucine--tRNA ligase [Candidatus Sungbacteria bacterium]|uniref:Leucine--tRNA ligase n=1 Tax=Candidatus Sungiibacteriota bacterium TaxID=2750080 RepID=A0A9D6LNJ6_9BACT|nr:leucine--tRNA ligase [Candidatus Sungbacteria bacterium]